MTPFGDVLKAAGGPEALAGRLPRAKSSTELRAVPDDRYLSLMSLRIFRAGIKHSVVDAKWPAFEDVFRGFDPGGVRAMNDEQLEALMGDARIVRHWGKIRATRDNAAAMCALAGEAGGIGAYFAEWPGATRSCSPATWSVRSAAGALSTASPRVSATVSLSKMRSTPGPKSRAARCARSA